MLQIAYLEENSRKLYYSKEFYEGFLSKTVIYNITQHNIIYHNIFFHAKVTMKKLK